MLTYVLNSAGNITSGSLNRNILIAVEVDAGGSMASAEQLVLQPLAPGERSGPIVLVAVAAALVVTVVTTVGGTTS